VTERRFKVRTHARRYVLNVTAAMLENEFNEPDFHEGWMFGGVENDEDRKLLAQEIHIFVAELLRKAKR
jgi:hypothetical protein